MCMNHFVVHLKLTQHCKPTKLQLNKKAVPIVTASDIHFQITSKLGMSRFRRLWIIINFTPPIFLL